MDWLNIGSSIAGLAGSLWSSNNANALQREMINSQMGFNREVMQNRHQWEVEDLRQAGLNPLMSVTSPTGTLSAPSAPSAHKADIANSALAIGQLHVADKQAEATMLNAQANAKNADTAYQAMLNQGKDIESQIKSRKWQNDVSWQMAQAQMESARTQAELNKALGVKQWIENSWYPKLQEAHLNEVNTRIMNSIKEVAAKISLMKAQERSALTIAEAQYMLSVTMEKNGISLRDLNAKQVWEIGKKMDLENQKFDFNKDLHAYDLAKSKHDAQVFEGQGLDSSATRSAHYLGNLIGELTGIAAFGALMK